jgi:hypothetical protein
VKYDRIWRRAGVTVIAAALGTSWVPAVSANSITVPVVSVASGSGPAQLMPAGGMMTANPEESLEAKFTKEQAIEKTRALFPMLKEAEVQNVELGSGRQYPPAQTAAVWSITWQMQYGSGSYGFQSQMDATNGDLLQIHIGGPSLSEDDEPYYPPKLTREQAVEEAKSFIAKAAGSMSVSDLKLNEQKQPRRTSLFGPIEYQFLFTRHVNGIPSGSESVGISLNGNGQVTTFYLQGGSAVYPSPVPAYSAEEALKRFKEQFQLQLAYIPKGRWGMSPTTEYFLGWQPVNKEIYTLDAQTGDFLQMTGEAKPASSVQGFQAVPKQGAVYTAAPGELTKEEAEERVRQLKLIPEEMLLSKEASSAQEHYPTGRKSWRLHWSEDGKPVFADNTWSAVVDATSGQIMELRKEIYSSSVMIPGEKAVEQPKTPSITEEAAKSKAFDLINQLYPNAADELKWMKGFSYGPSSNDHAFQFTFQRYVHDIMVVGNQIHMTLNGDGQLASYFVSGMSEPSSVPKLEPVVTEEQARKQYEEKLEMELHYQSFHPDMAAGVQAKPIVKLVYSPKLRGHEDGMGTVIDAVTGVFRSMWESSLSEGSSDRKPADVEGHWAEKSLQTLVEYQLLKLDAEGNVDPSGTVRTGEFMTMMAQALSPYFEPMYAAGNPRDAKLDEKLQKSPYAGAISYFLEQRLLKREELTAGFDPEGLLTREALAGWLTRLAGYEKLSTHLTSDSSVMSLKDYDDIADPGSVAVAFKLGLMNAAEETFRPKDTITRAEVAEVMMRLVYLQGKTDKRIGSGPVNGWR